MEPTLLPEQALAFYRCPTDYPELRNPRRALRGDAVTILQLALGAEPVSVGAPVGIADADEWQAAARFFIEQVLLAPGADYYRVNGLPRGAPEADVRDNYRLLMRLLHPDRSNLDEIWQAAAAARVNRAHATLRDPETRAAYNHEIALERLARAQQEAIEPRRKLRVRQRPANGDNGLGRGDTPMRRRVWRLVPNLVLGVVLGVALASVGWLWMERERAELLSGFDATWKSAPAPVAAVTAVPTPSPAPVAEVTAPTPTPVTEVPPPPPLPAVTVPPPIVARAEPVPPPKPVAPPVAPPKVAPPPPIVARAEPPAPPSFPPIVERTVPVPPPPPPPAPKVEPPPPPPPPAPKVEPPPPPPPPAPKVEPPPPPPPARKVEPPPPLPAPVAIAAPTVAPVIVSAPAPARPTAVAVAPPPRPPDPATLIPQLTQRYARGDLNGFMALFDAAARTETGGRAKIRSDYAEIFSSTTSRNLAVSGVNWIERNGTWHGEGRFQVTVERRDEATVHRYDGVIRLEVVADGTRPLIRGIFHKVTGQSVAER